MSKSILSFIIIFLLLSSCASVLHPWATVNTWPMYGNIEFPPEVVKINDKFISAQIEQFGSADSASKIYNDLGWHYLNKGKNDTAIRRFNQAWLLDSTNASPYFGFAAYSELISKADPNKYIKMGVKRDNNKKSEIFYLQNMAIYYQYTGRIPQSISYYNRVLNLAPNDTLAIKQRGHIFTAQEEWDKALLDLNRAVELGVNNYFTYDKLGYVYMNLGNDNLALKYYAKSIELYPDFLYPLYRSSILYLKLGNPEKALEYINRCLAIKNGEEQFIRTKNEILSSLNNK